MRKPRMLASLWAAVWLSWQVAAVRLRRVLGRAGRMPAATTDIGRYLPAAEAPVAGVDYEVGELPADLLGGLASVRASLADAAHVATPRRQRRRRRGYSIVLASAIGLVVAGGAANALVTGSTGVPAADRLLGIHERGFSDPEAARRPGPTGAELQPQTDGPSGSVSTRLGDGPVIVGTVYVARDGKVCMALATDGDGATTGGVDCLAPSALREYLARDEGFIFGYRRYGTTIVAQGLVTSRIADLDGREQPVTIELGPDWSDGDAAIEGVRPFLATGSGGQSPLLNPDALALIGHTDDGRRTDIDGRP